MEHFFKHKNFDYIIVSASFDNDTVWYVHLSNYSKMVVNEFIHCSNSLDNFIKTYEYLGTSLCILDYTREEKYILISGNGLKLEKMEGIMKPMKQQPIKLIKTKSPFKAVKNESTISILKSFKNIEDEPVDKPEKDYDDDIWAPIGKTSMRYSQEDIDDILARGIKKALEEERVARLARIKRNKLKKEAEAKVELEKKKEAEEKKKKDDEEIRNKFFELVDKLNTKGEKTMSTSEWAMPKHSEAMNPSVITDDYNPTGSFGRSFDKYVERQKQSLKPIKSFQEGPGIMVTSLPELQGTSSNVVKLVPQLLQELKNSKDVSDFGKKVSESLTTVADQILKSTNMSEMEQLTKPMSDLLVLCKTVNSKISGTDQRSIWQKIPIISMFYTSIVSTAAKAKTYFTTVESQITTIMNEIERQVPHIKQLNVALERMFEQNQNDYYSLEAHIQAGEKFIEIQTQELKEAAETLDVNDKMKVQELQDKQDLIDALSRRVNNFKALQVTCTQNAPSLRSQQQVGKISIEKYNDIKVLIIPAWKKNCARYIISLEQKKSLEMISNIDTTTDTMLRATNDTVNQNGLDAQKALNAGVIKVETLQEINDKLIKSLEELDTVRNQGRADLLENSKKYKQMNTDVNNQAKKMIQSNIDRLTSASN